MLQFIYGGTVVGNELRAALYEDFSDCRNLMYSADGRFFVAADPEVLVAVVVPVPVFVLVVQLFNYFRAG